MKYTQETLQQLSEDELTRICAEVCYELTATTFVKGQRVSEWFEPLTNTEKGRSQAFELAVKFDCFPNQKMFNDFYTIFVYRAGEWVHNEDPQAAIVIASILTAQQENNDE